MNLKRKQRFESRECPESGGYYAVWDLLKNDWYTVGCKLLTDKSIEKSIERCNHLQRQFEFANPLFFLDETMSGPDFMDDNYGLSH